MSARLSRSHASCTASSASLSDPADPDRELYESGAPLPGPGAILAGPTFEQWLDSTS